MKKRTRNLLPYFFLGFLTLCACWLFAGRHGIFGAKVDWISQHSVLPAYFRQQFYETGEWFPEFAPSLGAGQNIFHFSYYGLFSPVILLSYLLPFIRMDRYLMAASIAELVISVWLFYYWLGQKGFSKEIRFWTSVLFLLAGPMIYHSCHQIMFVNYMPFLCMALLGVDKHFKKNRSGLYILGVFLMILSSFYFSICGMLVLAFYGFSQYIQQEQKFRPGKFFKDAFSFLFPMAAAVLMSGFLLLPTALALLGKREGAGNTDLAALFTPQIPAKNLLYNCYGIGLPTCIFTVFFTSFTYRKGQERVLTYACALVFLFPFFAWALNGGLYVRGKSLIPFLPLLCYLTAVYLEKQKKREISFPVSLCAHLLTLALLCCCRDFPEWRLILADAVLMSGCFLLFWKSGQLFLLSVPPVLCLLLFGFLGGSFWKLEDPKTYAELTDNNIGALISQTLDEEPQICRLEQRGSEGEKGADLNRIWDPRQWISSLYSSAYHADYRKFWETEFQTEQPFRNNLIHASSNNPLYQKLMGIKYLVKNTANAKDAIPAGYEPYKTRGTLTVYKNKNAAPIAYATDRVIPEQIWRRLPFPYNQIALMKYAVVKNAPDNRQWKSEVKAWAKPEKLSLPQIDTEKAKAAYTADGTYHIQAKEKTNVTGRIQTSTRKWNTLLYLQFQVKNNTPDRDISIWVNGTRNRLSARSHIYYNGNTAFTYVSDLGENTQSVELTFGEGDYELFSLNGFLGDRRVLEEEAGAGQELYQSEFQADRSQTKENTIQGNISVKKAGWFITSIPYEPHSEVRINGKVKKAEAVNGVFLGFAVKKGTQNIQISYHAPGAKAGRRITYIGILLCDLFLYWQKKRRRNAALRE